MKILFTKKEPNIVRLNAYRSIELLVLNFEYAGVLVEQGVIPLLINCLDQEFEAVKVFVLFSFKWYTDHYTWHIKQLSCD